MELVLFGKQHYPGLSEGSMQRLWTNPIKPKFCLSQSLASFCSPVCVIFQAISLNMCFGFSKTPPSRRERWQSGNNAHCWTRVLVFGCTVCYIYMLYGYTIYIDGTVIPTPFCLGLPISRPVSLPVDEYDESPSPDQSRPYYTIPFTMP